MGGQYFKDVGIVAIQEYWQTLYAELLRGKYRRDVVVQKIHKPPVRLTRQRWQSHATASLVRP